MSAWAMLMVGPIWESCQEKVLQKPIILYTHFHVCVHIQVDRAQTSLLHWYFSACRGKHKVTRASVLLSQKRTQGAVLSHFTSSCDCCDLMETQSSFEFPTYGKSEGIQDQQTHQDIISSLGLSEPQEFQASLPLHPCDFAEAYCCVRSSLAIPIVLQAW